MTERLTGYAALDAMLDHLAPREGAWGPPELLRGGDRGRYANHRAFAALVAAVRAAGTSTFYAGPAKPLLLDQVTFGRDNPADEGEDDDEEIHFSALGGTVEVRSVRIRQVVPGVWSLVDRWGDDVTLALSPDAVFDETGPNTDEWDLPAPVSPFAIEEGQVSAFRERASAIVARFSATGPTDRRRADEAIKAHYHNVDPFRSDTPPVRWFSGPGAALEVLAAEGSDSAHLKRSLRDHPLMRFEMEATARLHSPRDALRDTTYRMTSGAVAADALEALRDRIIESKVKNAICYLGLIPDYQQLAWYEFLCFCGGKFPDVVRSFFTVASETWLLFPTRNAVLAVDRPVAIEPAGTDRRVFIFADGDQIDFNTGSGDGA